MEMCATEGLGGGRNAFFLMSIDGTPFVLMLLLGAFAGDGTWNLSAVIPPDLVGFEAGFAVIGRDQSGALGLSNQTFLAFP